MISTYCHGITKITDIIYSNRIITYLTIFTLSIIFLSLLVTIIIKNSNKHKAKPALFKKTELKFMSVVVVLIISWLLLGYMAYRLSDCTF